LPVLLVPAGYALWILYRAFAINDVSPDFSSPQRFIFSVMVSPTAYQVYKEQQFMLPWMAVWKAMKALAGGHLHWSAYGDRISCCALHCGVYFQLALVFDLVIVCTCSRFF
jgi:hypothetical protein